MTTSRHAALPFRLLATAIALACAHAPATAASFTIDGASTAPQTLGSGSGQTGQVTQTGSLVVGGSNVAVTVSGSNATLTNLGTISQTGTGRAIRDNTGVTGLVVTNGSAGNATARIQTADGDVIQMNRSPASVTVNNYGSMVSLNASAGGSQVIDFTAIASGANVVNNFAGALMQASEADAVRPGVGGVVFNAGTIRSITSTGSSSDGIDLQANSGVTVFNSGTGLVAGGRHGITGGAADASTSFAAMVTNDIGGVIRGDNGSGLNFDGFNALQVVTVVNRGTILGNGVTGDGDGIDIDGLVMLNNSGTIRSLNSFSALAGGLAYSEGISVGGGTILNSGTIEGLVAAGNGNAVGRGITLAGNDIASGPLSGTREGLYGNAQIVNLAGGTIRGQSDSGIVAEGARSGFTVTIDNRAGALIAGGGSTSAAIRAGADDTTIVNAGTIDGSSSGRAVQMGGGTNVLRVVGGSAQVLGNVDGGSGSTSVVLDPGAGQAFRYAGILSNVANVAVLSGTVTFAGASSYTGSTTVAGGTLVLEGANRLAAGSALVLDGGTLRLAAVPAGRTAQTFASLALGASSTIDLGFASLDFGGLDSVAAGSTLTLLNAVASGASGYAIRFFGDLSNDAAFLALMRGLGIDGFAASFRFDGTWTDVTAVALAPVPEPETWAMLAAGLAAIGAWSRRRARRPA